MWVKTLTFLFWLLWFCGVLKYLGRPRAFAPITYRLLIYFVIAVRFLSAGTLTWLQYKTWNGNEFTKLFLPPTHSWTYFAGYSFTHFWLNFLITSAVGALWFAFLRYLQKYNARFFDIGEVELGVLLSLVVGWPLFVIFVPLIFFSVIIISLVRLVFLRQRFTTLGLPFLLASALALLGGLRIIDLLHLGALKI